MQTVKSAAFSCKANLSKHLQVPDQSERDPAKCGPHGAAGAFFAYLDWPLVTAAGGMPGNRKAAEQQDFLPCGSPSSESHPETGPSRGRYLPVDPASRGQSFRALRLLGLFADSLPQITITIRVTMPCFTTSTTSTTAGKIAIALINNSEQTIHH